MSNPRRRILVIDDEPHIISVLVLKLKNAGYEVHTASDGEEGLAVAIAERPDLVITDYSMPYLSGLELCKKLKEAPETALVPALMLTARGLGLSSEDLEGTNVGAVVSKPFSPRELLTKIGKVLESMVGGGNEV